MKRRDFLRAASVPAAAATASAAAGTGAAQETEGGTDTGTATGTSTGTPMGTGTSTGTGTGTSGGSGGGGGPTVTVTVGPGGSLVFEPGTSEPLQIAPGTTVKFVWDSDNHNIVVSSQPEGANWQGTPGGEAKLYNTGYTYTHTFETLGTYEYYCAPHQSAGMVGTIEVVENPNAGGGGGKKELHSFGVPIHAHWVGAATILAILVTVIFTFYVLKYGESPHTGTGRNG
ncbi:plastocyanin/azurin family copper-binding protein [Halobellus sp. EA9]|uniref:plastocyanin/azurin family copper-binding protein n=1 Tax=Halobellus sp. EA9 TaxID=3421647 RepID=UPI003EC0FFB7